MVVFGWAARRSKRIMSINGKSDFSGRWPVAFFGALMAAPIAPSPFPFPGRRGGTPKVGPMS